MEKILTKITICAIIKVSWPNGRLARIHLRMHLEIFYKGGIRMNTNRPETEDNTNSGANEKTYRIFDGPSRDRLFDSCKYAWDSCSIVSLLFQVVVESCVCNSIGDVSIDRKPLEMRNTTITGIEHKDTSGDIFKLKGYCFARLYGDPKPLRYDFTAHYNTCNRLGSIFFHS